jgi:hypothetical protein
VAAFLVNNAEQLRWLAGCSDFLAERCTFLAKDARDLADNLEGSNDGESA